LLGRRRALTQPRRCQGQSLRHSDPQTFRDSDSQAVRQSGIQGHSEAECLGCVAWLAEKSVDDSSSHNLQDRRCVIRTCVDRHRALPRATPCADPSFELSGEKPQTLIHSETQTVRQSERQAFKGIQTLSVWVALRDWRRRMTTIHHHITPKTIVASSEHASTVT